MKFLVLISWLIGFCTFSGKLVAQPSVPVLCNTTDSLGLYHITIEFSKNTLTGLLILKQTSDSTLRLILNTNMGPKLIDMELSPSGYKTTYIFKKLNNRKILKTFYKDFGAISGILIKNKSCRIDQVRDSTVLTYDTGKKQKIVYYYNRLNGRINSGNVAERKSVKTIFYYFYSPDTSGISSMKLEHQHFRMIFHLNRIN